MESKPKPEKCRNLKTQEEATNTDDERRKDLQKVESAG